MTPSTNLALALIALQDALSGPYATLSRPKLRLLVKLADGPLSVSDLADRLHISSPAVSQMIDKLSLTGYVRRESLGDDQRMVGIALTPSGRETLAAGMAAFESRIEDVVASLDEEELTLFSHLLQKITEGSM